MRNLLIVAAVFVASFVFAGAAQAQYPNCYPGGVGYRGVGYGNAGYGGGYYGGSYNAYGVSGYGYSAYRGGYTRSSFYSTGIAPAQRVYTYGGPGLYPSRFSTGYGGVYGGYGVAPRVQVRVGY